MRALVFGRGSIYQEFYEPLLQKSKFLIEIYDPAIEGLDKLPTNSYFDIVIVASPPQFHISNAIQVIENNIAFEKLIIEKPALTSLSEWSMFQAMFSKKLNSIFTLTPRRLSPTYEFLVRNSSRLRSFEFHYNVLSKWTLNFESHRIYNNCLYDLGPHFVDLITSSLTETREWIISKRLNEFNKFNFIIRTSTTDGKFIVNRSGYGINIFKFILEDGTRGFIPLDTNGLLYSSQSFDNYSPKALKTANFIDEFRSLMQNNNSLLFSPVQDFLPVLNILEGVQND